MFAINTPIPSKGDYKDYLVQVLKGVEDKLPGKKMSILARHTYNDL